MLHSHQLPDLITYISEYRDWTGRSLFKPLNVISLTTAAGLIEFRHIGPTSNFLLDSGTALNLPFGLDDVASVGDGSSHFNIDNKKLHDLLCLDCVVFPSELSVVGCHVADLVELKQHTG
jgi:hypothetical protein